MNEGISVVIPAYNYRRFVSEALLSVLSQTHKKLEVIIVDDGSTDDTRRIIFRFQDPRIRYIYQTNQGLSAARNTGISNALYSYIAFLDADDIWLPEMLSSALDRMATLPGEYAVAACGSLRMTETGTPIDHRQAIRRFQREFRASDIVLKSRFMPSTVVARQKVFETAGTFDTTLRSSEDRDMWIRIAANHKIHYDSEPLVRIRKHGDNMSKNADRMRLNMRRVLLKYFHNTGYLSPRKLRNLLQAFSFNSYEVAWMYYDEKRKPEAIQALLASFLLWPIFFRPRQQMDQPILFRIRALARFFLG